MAYLTESTEITNRSQLIHANITKLQQVAWHNFILSFSSCYSNCVI